MRSCIDQGDFLHADKGKLDSDALVRAIMPAKDHFTFTLATRAAARRGGVSSHLPNCPTRSNHAKRKLTV